jgi:hypothetical protein
MAEQSIGMATGTGAGFGDGNVGSGYASSRMTAMETKTLSDGVLQVGNLFAMTGIGTGTLTIADGAAVVGGYFYENTSSAAIVISTLANATYNVVILVNNTAGSITVSRSVAGTTVTTYSVRLAVATAAQLVGQTYVQLGTVQVSGAVIAASGIVHNYDMYGTTTQLPYQSYATMSGGTATLTTASTNVDVTGYSSQSVTGDNIFSANTTTGEITVQRTGLYLATFTGNFSTGTTGFRSISLVVNGVFVARNTAIASGKPTSENVFTCQFFIGTAGHAVVIKAFSSTASQNMADGVFTISRV